MKTTRQAKILELIQKKDVETQEELSAVSYTHLTLPTIA